VTHWILWRGAVGVGIWDNVPVTQQPNADWHHYVVVYNRAAQQYSVAVDGVQVAYQLAVTDQKVETGDVQWSIGYPENEKSYVGDEWHGLLDDVRIYNRLLNPVDARGLYEMGVPPAVPLSITYSGTSVVISWPAEAAGYVLKSSPSLPNAAWSDVPGVINNSVTITPGPGNQFFRLQK
jgi:hypothetical protein